MFVRFEVFWSQNNVFRASPCKAMQNHLEILSTSQFLITYFLTNSFFLKIVVFDLQTTFFVEKPCSSGFWPKMLENAIKITSKSKFSTHFVQIPYHLHPARQGAHPALSNSLHRCFNCFQASIYGSTIVLVGAKAKFLRERFVVLDS